MQKPVRIGNRPEQEIKIALEKFRDIIQPYKPCYYKTDIDGTDYSGEYLMVEIMNIRSIGQNLYLAPEVRVDDGEFDIVLVAEEERQELADYISRNWMVKRLGLP